MGADLIKEDRAWQGHTPTRYGLSVMIQADFMLSLSGISGRAMQATAKPAYWR
jgi:hypothetical protein